MQFHKALFSVGALRREDDSSSDRPSSPLNLSLKEEPVIKTEIVSGSDDIAPDCSSSSTPSPPPIQAPQPASLLSPPIHPSMLASSQLPNATSWPHITRLQQSSPPRTSIGPVVTSTGGGGGAGRQGIWSPAVTCEQETTTKKKTLNINSNNNNNNNNMQVMCGDCGGVTSKLSPDMSTRCTTCHLSAIHRSERAFPVSIPFSRL